MSRMTPTEYLLLNLAGKIEDEFRVDYLPQEQAYRELKELTGQDFGLDEKAWRAWIRKNGLIRKKADS